MDAREKESDSLLGNQRGEDYPAYSEEYLRRKRGVRTVPLVDEHIQRIPTNLQELVREIYLEYLAENPKLKTEHLLYWIVIREVGLSESKARRGWGYSKAKSYRVLTRIDRMLNEALDGSWLQAYMEQMQVAVYHALPARPCLTRPIITAREWVEEEEGANTYMIPEDNGLVKVEWPDGTTVLMSQRRVIQYVARKQKERA